jgi:hypothetical protein
MIRFKQPPAVAKTLDNRPSPRLERCEVNFRFLTAKEKQKSVTQRAANSKKAQR